MFKLPISEYPEVVPPSIVVKASYPGANPTVISDTVAAPLEQEIVGVEDMLYMSSQATLDGNLNLTITFKIGTDIDRAQVQVQTGCRAHCRACLTRCARSASPPPRPRPTS